eukprot:7387416-Prymnesium_polylepis.1
MAALPASENASASSCSSTSETDSAAPAIASELACSAALDPSWPDNCAAGTRCASRDTLRRARQLGSGLRQQRWLCARLRGNCAPARARAAAVVAWSTKYRAMPSDRPTSSTAMPAQPSSPPPNICHSGNSSSEMPGGSSQPSARAAPSSVHSTRLADAHTATLASCAPPTWAARRLLSADCTGKLAPVAAQTGSSGSSAGVTRDPRSCISMHARHARATPSARRVVIGRTGDAAKPT